MTDGGWLFQQPGLLVWSRPNHFIFRRYHSTNPSPRPSSANTTVTSVQRVSALKALCVGRHRYLSDHFGQFFRKLGVDAACVVGIADAIVAAHKHRPDVVFCEYD